ncbi:MAG: pilus assembly protein [Lentisphaeria bacterium]|nr:pilus assembly protein [Lentisphaeria bacterium]MBQ7394639.1 pilus assembly protein [Lentisphaeria bacterium]
MKKAGSVHHKPAFSKASGQVIVEYVIMLVIILLIALGVLGFSYYFNLYGERMTDSVSIEYP